MKNALFGLLASFLHGLLVALRRIGARGAWREYVATRPTNRAARRAALRDLGRSRRWHLDSAQRIKSRRGIDLDGLVRQTATDLDAWNTLRASWNSELTPMLRTLRDRIARQA